MNSVMWGSKARWSWWLFQLWWTRRMAVAISEEGLCTVAPQTDSSTLLEVRRLFRDSRILYLELRWNSIGISR
jgi:hypothetical protein